MSNELREINGNTFTAEAKKKIGAEDWDIFLQRVLSEDFRMRRSNPSIAIQNRDEMIAYIQDREGRERKVSDVVVFEDAGYGVVTSVVALEGETDRFHNIKVFVRQASEDWQCVYWQVSRLTSQ